MADKHGRAISRLCRENAKLKTRIADLEAAVEAAYQEGHRDGGGYGEITPSKADIDADLRDSQAARDAAGKDGA